MSTTVATKDTGNALKKGISSLKVPKKAINESALELINVNSDDFLEEIDAHLQHNYRFRKLANDALKIDGAWFIHNRSLEEAFGKARKRLQLGDGLGQSKSISLTTHYGFLFTKNWSVVESIAYCGLKTGNLQDTWLGKSKDGVVISQCADIGLAYLADTKSKEAESYHGDSEIEPDSKIDCVTSDTYFVVLVRWLKGKVYMTQAMPPASPSSPIRSSESGSCPSPSLDSRLDPQPGYTCHMTKWSRMDPLDPSKITLNEVFHNSQVYLYEYDEEMDLKVTVEHVLPFAVIKCHWGLMPEDFPLFRSVNDGAILLPRKMKESTGPRKSLLSTPPAATKIPLEKCAPKPTPKKWIKGKHIAALLFSPAPPKKNDAPTKSLLPNRPKAAPKISTLSTVSSSAPLRDTKSIPYTHHPPDPIAASGRVLQKALDRTYMQPDSPANDGLVNYVINTCYLVWPVSEHPECVNDEVMKIESWQFPVKIISHHNHTSHIYEGLLQPRFIVSDLVSFSRLHHELAGVQEPYGPNAELSVSDIIETTHASETTNLDPRRLRGRSNFPPCPPFVSIDRLHGWVVPTKENAENDASAKPSRFAGYRGNYLLLSLPESSTQRSEVAKLCDTLRERQVACFIKMPRSENAVFCIFPDSEFSKSIGIPPLESAESTSFHGILLLPHSFYSSLFETCLCQPAPPSRTGIPRSQLPAPVEIRWRFSLSSLVHALPNGGQDLLQAASSFALDPKDGSEAFPSATNDNVHIFSQTFTPMSPQEPTSCEDTALVIPIPDVQIPESPIQIESSPAISCDMELETSFESNVPISPEKWNGSSSHDCDTPIPTIPSVPDKYSPYSLALDIAGRSPQIAEEVSKNSEYIGDTPTSLLSIRKVRGSPATFSDYNEWRKKKDQKSTSQLQASSSAKDPQCTEALQEACSGSLDTDAVVLDPSQLLPDLIGEKEDESDHVKLFSPASPDDKPMASISCSSRDPSHEEEEEGEIVDDEDGEIEGETDVSSECSRPSPESAKRKSRDGGHKPIHIPSSPRKKRSKHSSHHHQAKKLKKRKKHVEDMDYRTPRPQDTRLTGVERFLEYSVNFPPAMPHTNRFKDTDYRYQVYIPKSAETVSVPVKVINHAYEADNEALHNHDKFSSRSGRDVHLTQPSTSSVSRNRNKNRDKYNSEKVQLTSQRSITSFNLPFNNQSSTLPSVYDPNANGIALLETPTSRITNATEISAYRTAPMSYAPGKLRLQTSRTRPPLVSNRSDKLVAALVNSNSESSGGV